MSAGNVNCQTLCQWQHVGQGGEVNERSKLRWNISVLALEPGVYKCISNIALTTGYRLWSSEGLIICLQFLKELGMRYLYLRNILVVYLLQW